MQLHQRHGLGYLACLEPARSTTTVDGQPAQFLHAGDLIEKDGLRMGDSPDARPSGKSSGGVDNYVARVHASLVDFDQGPVNLMLEAFSGPSSHTR